MRTNHRIIKTVAATAVTLGLGLCTALPALADLVGDTGLSATAGGAGLTGAETDLTKIVGRFIGGLITLLGVVFVVLVIYGGFTWMTAQGNEEKIKKAKNIITSAVIGLVLVFASYAIASTVINVLSSATTPAVAPTP